MTDNPSPPLRTIWRAATASKTGPFNFPLWLSLVLLWSVIESPAAVPEIVGSLQFSNQVHQALILLQTRDTNAYAIVTNYIGRIAQGQQSGMWAYKNPPTYEMGDSTTFYSLTWCAATIAHDSFHSKLYHDYGRTNAGVVPDNVWTGKAAEQQCMAHQILVMQHIGASKREIDHAKSQADGHYAKENETWEEYKKRTW